MFGMVQRGIGEQRVDRGEPPVAGADTVAPIVFEVVEERGDERSVDVGDGEIRFPGPGYSLRLDADEDQSARVLVDGRQVINTPGPVGTPAVASWGNGRIDLFARGTDDALWHKWYDGTWHGWENLGGYLTSDPAAVSWGPGEIHVVARGGDNRLWFQYFHQAAGWSGWAPVPASPVVTAAPSISSWGPGRLDIFGLATDGTIRSIWYQGGWGSWYSLGGYLTSAPAATSWGPGVISVFARGGDNAVWNRNFINNAWGNWASLGGSATSAPAVVSRGAWNLDVFVRSTDKAIWTTNFNGAGWSGWSSRGGALSGGVGASRWSASVMHIFAFGVDDKLYSQACCGWGAWAPIDNGFRRGALPFSAEANRSYRIRVETTNPAGAARVDLRWVSPSGAEASVPGTNLTPYGLPTSSTDPDGLVVATEYAAPHLGQATASVVDPAGANLRTTTAYEPEGSGFRRRTSRALPSGATTTYAHYGATEGRTNPCDANQSFGQGGLPRLSTGPDPDGAGPQVAQSWEQVYDNAGRVVASRRNGEGSWTCRRYDARGRMVWESVPAWGPEAARTTTITYASGGDPTVTVTSDGSGTSPLIERVDLLGRPVASTDAWGLTTTTTYDPAGRLSATAGPGGTVGTDYAPNGWVDAQRLDGAVVADPSYTAAGELASVAYPNATTLSLSRDANGRVVGMGASGPGGSIATDAVVRRPSGRVVDQSIDGLDARAGADNFVYDGAGRLSAAWVPGHVLTYAFAPSGGCGVATGAGRNTNRTSAVDNGVTTTYCYDHADKLTSVSGDPRYASAIAYDARGAATSVGGETLVYDGAERHVATTKDATTVRYGRDATGRIIERRVNGAVVARYAYGGPGDAPVATLDANGAVIERTVALVGGALLTRRLGAADAWSYPNVHGDVMATADAAGAKVGPTHTYDPYGQALTTPPDNSAGSFDYAWLGSHQRPLEAEAGMATIEMGARPYVPGLGRFLRVDPVEGGSANDYDYTMGEPCNNFDLDGRKVIAGILGPIKDAVKSVFSLKKCGDAQKRLQTRMRYLRGRLERTNELRAARQQLDLTQRQYLDGIAFWGTTYWRDVEKHCSAAVSNSMRAGF